MIFIMLILSLDNNIYYGSLPDYFRGIIFSMLILSLALIWPPYFTFLVYPIENLIFRKTVKISNNSFFFDYIAYFYFLIIIQIIIYLK